MLLLFLLLLLVLVPVLVLYCRVFNMHSIVANAKKKKNYSTLHQN